MQAWVVHECGPIDSKPLRRIDRDLPVPARARYGSAISCCGVCRTDLHLAEGDLPPRRAHVTPGHEVVGRVEALGPAAHRFSIGERVGIPWLARTDQSCRYCRRGDENLCSHPAFTGWDMDGGYADSCVADEQFAYRLPDGVSDEQAAPLLCAGIIGYRSLRAAAVPAGGNLGIYGFGGSAHLTAQIALHLGFRVHVLTRGEHNRQLASRPRRGLGRPGYRQPAGTARWRHPVCTRRCAGPSRVAGTGLWSNTRRRRHLVVRHPGPELRRRALP